MSTPSKKYAPAHTFSYFTYHNDEEHFIHHGGLQELVSRIGVCRQSFSRIEQDEDRTFISNTVTNQLRRGASEE